LSDAGDKEVQAAYEYNFARALELLGKPAAANEHYRRARALSPKLTAAALGISRTAAAQKETGFEDALPVAQHLLEQGLPKSAAQQARTALRQGKGEESAAAGLVSLLAKAYVRIPMTPAQYVKTEQPDLYAAATAAASSARPSVKRLIDDM